MNTGNKIKTKLNFNLLTEKMIFDNNGTKLAIKNIQDIDTVFVANKKFLVKNDLFFEVIYNADFDLYVEHKGKLKEEGKKSGYGGTSRTASITSYSSINKDDRLNELDVPYGFKVENYNYYWLYKQKKYKKFISVKQLTKVYKTEKDFINNYIKKNKVDFNNEEAMLTLFKQLEKAN